MIHAQLPLRMPCYDFTHITDLTLDPAKAGASGTASSLGVTDWDNLRLFPVPTEHTDFPYSASPIYASVILIFLLSLILFL